MVLVHVTNREELKFLNIASDLSLAFLELGDRHMHTALEKYPKASGDTEVIKHNGRKETRLVGNAGDLVVHL